MNQTDGKRVLAIFVVALSTLFVETCPENQFQLPNSLCCMRCPEGMFVTNNCSKIHEKYNGVQCKICRRCEDVGQITVSNCTLFSDTQCEMGPSFPTNQPQIEGQLLQMTLFGCSLVVVAVFMLAVIMAVCFFIRNRKSGESDESSEGEPCKRRDSLKKILI